MTTKAGVLLVALAALPLATPALAQSGSISIVLKPGSTSGASAAGGHGRHARHKKAAADTAGKPATTPAGAPRPGFHGDRLDNDAILALTRIGLGDPAIIAKIRASQPHFDIATDTLVALRHAGVSSAVLAAMIDQQATAGPSDLRPDSADPHDLHPAGFYLLASWLATPKMLAMRPQNTARTSAGNLVGYALTGGLLPVNYSAVLPGDHANLVAGDRRPVFYVYTGAATASQSLVSNWGAPPAPEDVSLVRFAVTKSGREVRIGTFTIGGAHTGIAPRDAIGFSSAEVAPGVLVLRPDRELPPGEYGFIQTAGGAGPGGAQVATSTARVFDFTIGSAAEGSHASDLAGLAGTVAQNGDDSAALSLAEAALLAVARQKPTRTTRARLPKLPNSSPSLYPGGK